MSINKWLGLFYHTFYIFSEKSEHYQGHQFPIICIRMPELVREYLTNLRPQQVGASIH